MPEYERINFRKEWHDQVSQYLKEHPEEGFEQDEVKEFLKLLANKYMNGALVTYTGEMEEFIENLKDSDNSF